MFKIALDIEENIAVTWSVKHANFANDPYWTEFNTNNQ